MSLFYFLEWFESIQQMVNWNWALQSTPNDNNELKPDNSDKRNVDHMTSIQDLPSEAVEELCMRKGYGTEHGAPRRMAQGRCRALIARAATAKQDLIFLFMIAPN